MKNLRISIASPIPSLATCGAINSRTIPVLFGSDGAGGVVGTVTHAKPGGRGPTAELVLLQDHPDAARLAELLAKAPGCIRFSATNGNIDAIKVEVATAREDVEFSAVGAAVTAGTAAAGRRVAAEGLRWPPRVPAPLNGWKTTGKRFWRINKPTLIRSGIDGLIVGSAVYAGSKLAQKADDEKRRAKLNMLSAKLDNAINLSRPSLDRLVDAADRNVDFPQPHVPYVEEARTTAGFVKKHPTIKRALLRAGAIAAGGVAGAYLGHRMHGASRKGFVRAGAGIGALGAATLFSMNDSPENLTDSIATQIDRAAGNARAGHAETQSLSTLPSRLGISLDLVQFLLADGTLKPERPLYDDRWDGPLIFDSDHLNEVKKHVLAQVAADAVEGVDGDDDHLRAVAGQAMNDFASKATTTELARGESGQYTEEEPSTLAKIGKVAAVGAGALAAGSLLRGVGALGPARAAQAGLLGTARFGARKLTRDAAGILGRATAAMRR